MDSRKLRPEEKQYIRENCFAMTDEELAKHLNRNIKTIIKARRALGIKKDIGGRLKNVFDNVSQDEIAPQLLQASQQLTEQQRKEFFKTQLTNTLYYDQLKKQFSKEEIDFYLEEWGSLCVQFEDIVATEKRQIDELIKAEIMGNRILRHIQNTEEEITNLQQEIETFRATNDVNNSPELQEKDTVLSTLVRTMAAVSGAMTNDYQKNVNTKNGLLNELNARRKDRVDQLKKSTTTFLGLVESLRQREIREHQGRHIELVRIAKEKKKSEWRKPNKFPDGSLDCLLLDDKSQLPTGAVDITRQSIINKYGDLSDKNILVVDNDIRRVQLFQDLFKGNRIDIASSYDKAISRIESTNYDLICLDYDLGLDKKGIEVAEHIVQKNISPDILIHSMNEEGSKEMSQLLRNFSIEVNPFESIVKNLEKENA
jgi:CheY-like chemotaxis protein